MPQSVYALVYVYQIILNNVVHLIFSKILRTRIFRIIVISTSGIYADPKGIQYFNEQNDYPYEYKFRAIATKYYHCANFHLHQCYGYLEFASLLILMYAIDAIGINEDSS